MQDCIEQRRQPTCQLLHALLCSVGQPELLRWSLLSPHALSSESLQLSVTKLTIVICGLLLLLLLASNEVFSFC